MMLDVADGIEDARTIDHWRGAPVGHEARKKSLAASAGGRSSSRERTNGPRRSAG
jgi:hypothetical protein